MPGQTYPFQLQSGDFKSIGPIAFFPAAVGVDNPTPFYVHFTSAGFGAWVRPYTSGAVVLSPAKDRTIFVSTKDVPGGGVVPPPTTLVASCLAFEDPQAPSPGYPLGASVAACTSLSRANGTYNFDVPAQSFAKGLILYSFVSAGAGTVTFAIQDRDAAVGVTSNSYVTSAAIPVGSGNILRLYPGLTPLVNFDVSGIIGQTPRIVAVVGGGATTFATDYALVP
jgi:hypothetical protein